MADKRTLLDAQKLLASLRVGDTVVVDGGYGETNMTVTRSIHHPDGYGAWESYGVSAHVRPGGYSVFVSVSAIAEGFKRLRTPT